MMFVEKALDPLSGLQIAWSRLHAPVHGAPDGVGVEVGFMEVVGVGVPDVLPKFVTKRL